MFSFAKLKYLKNTRSPMFAQRLIARIVFLPLPSFLSISIAVL
jgi:hypothetical protein